MKFSEFVYKRTDVDEVRNRIREITEELKHASSLEEQIQAVYKMNEVEKEISTADSLVYIRYTINTKNEFYAKEREYNDRISPMLEEEFQKYNEVLLQSRFRRELEEKFGKVLFLNLELAMKGFSPEITELLQEEVTDPVSDSACRGADRISGKDVQSFPARTIYAEYEPGSKKSGL